MKDRKTRLEKADIVLSFLALTTLETKNEEFKEKQFLIIERFLDSNIIDNFFNDYSEDGDFNDKDMSFIKSIRELYYQIRAKTSHRDPDEFYFGIDFLERLSYLVIISIFVERKENL